MKEKTIVASGAAVFLISSVRCAIVPGYRVAGIDNLAMKRVENIQLKK